MYFNNCNTGCGCNANSTGCGGNTNNGGCGGNVKPNCGNAATNGCNMTNVYPTSSCAMYPRNVNNCGYRCANIQATPITLPERVNYSHCCCVHEQPVIVPINNRMVNHHTFAPRYYEVNRVSQEDVIEANPYTAMNNMNGYGNNGCATNGCSNICPNFLNM